MHPDQGLLRRLDLQWLGGVHLESVYRDRHRHRRSCRRHLSHQRCRRRLRHLDRVRSRPAVRGRPLPEPAAQCQAFLHEQWQGAACRWQRSLLRVDPGRGTGWRHLRWMDSLRHSGPELRRGRHLLQWPQLRNRRNLRSGVRRRRRNLHPGLRLLPRQREPMRAWLGLHPPRHGQHLPELWPGGSVRPTGPAERLQLRELRGLCPVPRL